MWQMTFLLGRCGGSGLPLACRLSPTGTGFMLRLSTFECVYSGIIPMCYLFTSFK